MGRVHIGSAIGKSELYDFLNTECHAINDKKEVKISDIKKFMGYELTFKFPAYLEISPLTSNGDGIEELNYLFEVDLTNKMLDLNKIKNKIINGLNNEIALLGQILELKNKNDTNFSQEIKQRTDVCKDNLKLHTSDKSLLEQVDMFYDDEKHLPVINEQKINMEYDSVVVSTTSKLKHNVSFGDFRNIQNDVLLSSPIISIHESVESKPKLVGLLPLQEVAEENNSQDVVTEVAHEKIDILETLYLQENNLDKIEGKTYSLSIINAMKKAEEKRKASEINYDSPKFILSFNNFFDRIAEDYVKELNNKNLSSKSFELIMEQVYDTIDDVNRIIQIEAESKLEYVDDSVCYLNLEEKELVKDISLLLATLIAKNDKDGLEKFFKSKLGSLLYIMERHPSIDIFRVGDKIDIENYQYIFQCKEKRRKIM